MSSTRPTIRSILAPTASKAVTVVAAGVVAAALIVTVGLGLAGTLLALNQKPATVLRNL